MNWLSRVKTGRGESSARCRGGHGAPVGFRRRSLEDGVFLFAKSRKAFFSKKEKKKGEPCRTVELLLLRFPASLPIPSESHGMDQILKEKTYLRIQNVHMS